MSLFDADGAYIWQREEGNLVGIAADGHAKADFVGSTIKADEDFVFAADVAARGEGTFSNNFKKEEKINLRLPAQESIE
nr:hypothetical protein [candidate division Zixibacteria bacterium]NIW46749.1 hypothetical protein [Gammaproteobacteria bacterium]